jgi:hypothetical protein
MLETLKGLLDAGKAATYELLALLLPGAVVLAALMHTTGFGSPFGAIGEIAICYIIGTVLQAFADYLLKRKPIRRWTESEKTDWKVAQAYALRLIQRRLSAAPSEATLDICLTHVGARRSVYDKFMALRDTARGLAFATLVSAALVIWDEWSQLIAGSTPYAALKVSAVIVLVAIIFLAFVQRYARFQPLAQQAVYGQFIATQLDASYEAAHDGHQAVKDAPIADASSATT